MDTFKAATDPTVYFIGVTTGQSAIRQVFPLWDWRRRHCERGELRAAGRVATLPCNRDSMVLRQAKQPVDTTLELNLTE
jgi:hypothetical protein